MEVLQCHSSSSKKEVLDFAARNKGKVIFLCWESNLNTCWGDDEVTKYDTSIQESYDELINKIRECYVHFIEVV